MAAPFHNILSKVDRALVAFLISKEAGTAEDVLPAKRGGNVPPAPFTVCYGSKASETIANSADFEAEVEIVVKSQAAQESPDDTTLALELASEQRVAKTFDCFFEGRTAGGNETVAAEITAAARAQAAEDPTRSADLADFSCFSVKIGHVEQGFEEDTGMWVDRLSLVLTCCPKAIDG